MSREPLPWGFEEIYQNQDFLAHIGMPRRSGRFPWGSGKNPFQSAISFMGAVAQKRKEGIDDTTIARGLGLSSTDFRLINTWAEEEIRQDNRTQAIELQRKGMGASQIARRMGLPNESSVRSLLDPVIAERKMKIANTADLLANSVDSFKYVEVGTGAENTIGVSRVTLDRAIRRLEFDGAYQVHQVYVKQLGMAGKKTRNRVLTTPLDEGQTRTDQYKEIVRNIDAVKPVLGRSVDNGATFSNHNLEPVVSIDSKRVMIREGKDGGAGKDGVIEMRRGVSDLDLGRARYAQVRIGVDGTHYMKGMALYTDDIPRGIDIIYNTNKNLKPGDTAFDVFKPMKTIGEGANKIIDQSNPFGATISRQALKTGETPDSKNIGCLNIIQEEGQWNDWTRALSSQMLSKQSPTLARQQLDIQHQIRLEEFDTIKNMTNSAVRRQLLQTLADACMKDAEELQAAAMPRQANKILLPIQSMKPNEIYAPGFANEEVVALIRHPHGGTFEIPQLVVNNKNREARAIMNEAVDAVGIHPSVAGQLSGADFDGDHVIVVPNSRGQIKTAGQLSEPLRNLHTFDTRESYPPFDGMKTIDGGVWREKRLPDGTHVEYPKDSQGRLIKKKTNMQNQMGRISNLITDMQIIGASDSKIARAVRHSMVIIDSEKHSLNYKHSEKMNGISALRQEYQPREKGPAGGATTLISRAGSEISVPERKAGQRIGPASRIIDPETGVGRPTVVPIDPETGRELFTPTGRVYTPGHYRTPDGTKLTISEARIRRDQGETIEWVTTGRETLATEKSTRMKEIAIGGRSAVELTSGPSGRPGTIIEGVYANHADRMIALANQARALMVNTPRTERNPSAAVAYASEVASLNAKHRLAVSYRPVERDAQRIANSVVQRQLQDNPSMTPQEEKRAGTQALEAARRRLGIPPRQTKDGRPGREIVITDREWEAIQAGAISESRLAEILRESNETRVRQLATPRDQQMTITPTLESRAREMLANGATRADVASLLGIPVNVLVERLNL